MKPKALVLPAKVLFTLALGAGLLSTIDLQRLGAAAAGLGAGTVAAAAALLALQALLFGWRWQRLLDLLGHRLPLGLAVRWVWVGLFFNQALPASVGGDVMRVWLLHRRGSAPGVAFASVALERLTGVALLGVLVSACMAAAWGRLPLAAALALVAIGPALLLLLAVLAFVDRLPIGWLPQRLLPSIQGLSGGLRRLAAQPSALLWVSLQGLAANLLGIGAAHLLGQAMGVQLPLAAVVVVVGGAVLVSVLPVSLGGWGVREASMVTLAAGLGGAAESVLAMSLAWGALQLVMALPGGILWWRDTRLAPTDHPDIASGTPARPALSDTPAPR